MLEYKDKYYDELIDMIAHNFPMKATDGKYDYDYTKTLLNNRAQGSNVKLIRLLLPSGDMEEMLDCYEYTVTMICITAVVEHIKPCNEQYKYDMKMRTIGIPLTDNLIKHVKLAYGIELEELNMDYNQCVRYLMDPANNFNIGIGDLILTLFRVVEMCYEVQND